MDAIETKASEDTMERGNTSKNLLNTGLRYPLFCALALIFLFLSNWVLNVFIFPQYDIVLNWTREISTASNALTLIAIALFATWKTRIFNERFFVTSIALGYMTGIVLTAGGLFFTSIPLLVIGASLTAIGRGITMGVVGLACINLSLKKAGAVVAGSYLAAFLLRMILLVAPPALAFSVFALGSLFSLIIGAPYANSIFRQMRGSETRAERALTQPSSFLPFGHQLFICILFFRIAYGYALTFGEVDGTPLLTTLALIPLTLVAIFAFISKKALNPDILFNISFLFVIAGFLWSLVLFVDKEVVVNTLLMSGVGCFDILLWFVLIALGSRNTLGALSTFAWGFAMNSIGVIIGANFGRLTNSSYGVASPMVSFVTAVLVLLFVAYVVIALKDFSFKSTVEGVLPDSKPISHMEVSLLASRCKEISTRHGLTTRETEVFELLARGRNGRFIQEELVVSYNTVKAHVKHIYTKLGIHTQQELIDLVEDEDPCG